MSMKPGVLPVLRVMSLGHSMVAFVNGDIVGKHTNFIIITGVRKGVLIRMSCCVLGTAHGTHEEKSFEFQTPVLLRVGTNYISLLSSTVGLPVRGSNFIIIIFLSLIKEESKVK